MSFSLGGQGRVECCRIWGNPKANLQVRDSGTQAVVKGCECADAWAFFRPATFIFFFLFCSFG